MRWNNNQENSNQWNQAMGNQSWSGNAATGSVQGGKALGNGVASGGSAASGSQPLNESTNQLSRWSEATPPPVATPVVGVAVADLASQAVALKVSIEPQGWDDPDFKVLIILIRSIINHLNILKNNSILY